MYECYSDEEAVFSQGSVALYRISQEYLPVVWINNAVKFDLI